METLLIDPKKPSPYVALGLAGFIGKLKTYFNVKIDGAYRFYFMLGPKDFGQVRVDGIKVADINCSANPKPKQVGIQRIKLDKNILNRLKCFSAVFCHLRGGMFLQLFMKTS